MSLYGFNRRKKKCVYKPDGTLLYWDPIPTKIVFTLLHSLRFGTAEEWFLLEIKREWRRKRGLACSKDANWPSSLRSRGPEALTRSVMESAYGKKKVCKDFNVTIWRSLKMPMKCTFSTSKPPKNVTWGCNLVWATSAFQHISFWLRTDAGVTFGFCLCRTGGVAFCL